MGASSSMFPSTAAHGGDKESKAVAADAVVTDAITYPEMRIHSGLQITTCDRPPQWTTTRGAPEGPPLSGRRTQVTADVDAANDAAMFTAHGYVRGGIKCHWLAGNAGAVAADVNARLFHIAKNYATASDDDVTVFKQALDSTFPGLLPLGFQCYSSLERLCYAGNGSRGQVVSPRDRQCGGLPQPVETAYIVVDDGGGPWSERLTFRVTSEGPSGGFQTIVRQRGSSEFGCDSLLFPDGNTFVKDIATQLSYNIGPDGSKEPLCEGGVMLAPAERSFARDVAWDELHHHYAIQYEKLPDRFVIIYGLGDIEVFDKKSVHVIFKKCLSSQDAYGRAREVCCGESGKRCTDEEGRLLPGQDCFYHEAEGQDLGQDYGIQARMDTRPSRYSFGNLCR